MSKPQKINKTKQKSTNTKKNIFLFIQVFQMGIVQTEKKFDINSIFNKKIRIGANKFCDLYLPHDHHIFDFNIFKIGKGKVEIFLDPRLDGYINTSQKFGDLHEFTAPRNALGVLTSVEDPLAVNLKQGARGRIRFFGFEIVFKIEEPQKEKIYKNLPRIERSFFPLPSFDSPIERYIILISLFATICLFFPILNLLLSFPTHNLKGFLNLPTEITLDLIAPKNIRLLPAVYGAEFKRDKVPQMSMLWIKELQMRWDQYDSGNEYISQLPFLSKPQKAIPIPNHLSDFQKKVNQSYEMLESNRIDWIKNERYYSYIKKSPLLASILSGKSGDSNTNIISKRLIQLDKTDLAILEYLKLEHLILKEFYKTEYNSKKIGIVTPPFTGQLLGRQPDPLFKIEFENYKIAEFFAQKAEDSNYRNYLNEFNQEAQNLESTKPVTLSNKDLLYPLSWVENSDKLNEEEDYKTLIYNALFSDAFILPPLPKPKPIIDLKMVQFVVFNKKQEIRSCYNSALRKNSNLKGDIKLSWGINEQGSALNIKMLHSTLNESSLFECIESRIKRWKFPKSKNGISVVSFPFQFISSE